MSPRLIALAGVLFGTILLGAIVLSGCSRKPTATGSQQERAPSTGLPRQLCDVDWDGDCDAHDYDLAVGSAGKCLGEAGYERGADTNRDGCVTREEVDKLFPDRAK